MRYKTFILVKDLQKYQMSKLEVDKIADLAGFNTDARTPGAELADFFFDLRRV